MIKNKYEISLWNDKFIKSTETIPAHYEEEKICILGSDSMTSQARVVEPKLVQNVNGTNILTFKLFYYYIDNETGEKVRNPFLSLLVNERKIKCRWDNKWYDFVIKGIQEDSSGKSITYTCSDLFVNELSKTGFNLEFNTDLNNNQGTAQELAEKVLEGTDWKLDIQKSDHILQTIEEPLYKTITTQVIDTLEGTKIGENSEIYLFYSVVSEKETFIQFIYNEKGYETEANSQLLKENNCFSIEVADYDKWLEKYTTGIGSTLSDYRGKRLIRQQLQEFNDAVGRNCYVFNKSNTDKTKVLGYSTIEYKDPTVILNLISNSKDFVDTNGWLGNLEWQLYPLFYNSENIPIDYEGKTYLLTSGEQDSKNNYLPIFNSGLQNSAIYLENGLQTGQKYIVRIKAYADDNGKPSNTLIAPTDVSFQILDYFNSLGAGSDGVPEHNSDSYCNFTTPLIKNTYVSTKDTTPSPEKTYYIWENKEYTVQKNLDSFSADLKYYELGDKVIEFEVEILKSIPRADITAGYLKEAEKDNSQHIAKPGLFIYLPKCWLEEIQFYQKVEGYNGQVIHIGDLDTQSVGTTYYKYFIPNNSYKNEDDIKFLYSGTEKQTGYVKLYKDDTKVLYEKIRSINKKQSNRFNLLQSIAETFECWVRFNIDHDSSGKIIYDNGFPKKTVYLKEKIGNELGYGFKYGIDLKTISRSIDSNQITTKVIVSPNINEHAEEGICEIAKSLYSETGENYIYDFGYYISQGLLNSGELNKYFYLPEDGTSGFYIQLKQLNTEYNTRVQKIAAKKIELSKQASLQTVYDQYVSSAQEEIISLRSQLAQLAGLKNYNIEKVLAYISNHQDNEKAINLLTTLTTTEHNLENYKNSLFLIEKSVSNLTSFIDTEEEKNKKILDKKKNLEENFYKRFSRFIQEGSWTSQDYIDENLYYLDAKSVAYTSSRPKVSYNISVIRLNALPEFAGKIFNVGDISYIEDTEFFGYVIGKNGWKTPYRERILISEKTINFDSPEKDTFTVQNYKTQFEDLFQRITSTTQSLQYSTGEYNRASNAIEGKGVINSETLQNSININNELVFKSQNEAIFQDSTGLTLSDTTDPSKKTKLTSGGLFISVDGGVTWKNAVRGEGVSTQYLTSGSINTENISILDGQFPTFRWDKYGLNAFEAVYENDTLVGIVDNNYIRFDQFGIYGVNQSGSNTPLNPKSLDEVKENAFFGLIRNGFFLKSEEENGIVEISSENNILVKTDEIERIKIGKLSESQYGLRIKDKNNIISLETDDNGKLWLKDSLNIYNTTETYVLSTDTIVDDTKTYYQLDKENNTYIKVITPYGNPSKNGYFEKYNYDIKIGNIETSVGQLNQVFNANNNFIVYEDGSIKATTGSFSGDITGSTGTFSGKIFASSGRIGGLEINGDFTREPIAEIREDKLVIKGTGLEVRNNNGDLSLGALSNGNLIFSGELQGATGTFSGDISAASGTFSGGLLASSGKIGGFKISLDYLYKEIYKLSEDTSRDINKKYYALENGEYVEVIFSNENSVEINPKEKGYYEDDINNSPLILFGTEGKIKTTNIELGSGAKIVDKIVLSSGVGKPEAYIYNPEKYSDVFLKAGNLELKTNGLFEIGDIIIDGSAEGPSIRSTKWAITPDTATFKNVIAQGGTIENVVFSNSSTQSAGGIMIFKPSGTCSYDSTQVTEGKNIYYYLLDKNSNLELEQGTQVLLQKYEANVEIVEELGDSFKKVGLCFSKSYNEEDIINPQITYTLTTLYGFKEGELVDSLLIGINSSNVAQFNLKPKGITLISPKLIDGEVVYPDEPGLFIGDLSSIDLSGRYKGYGLIGDNVYLNGTLTTKVKGVSNSTYAGVNTTTGVASKKFGDFEKIVFWAGAENEKDTSIQEAPFQVTDYGNLYASRGKFSNSIFTDSSIYGGDIYTARIHGYENDTSSALSIYNTGNEKGITFFEGDKVLTGEEEKVTLQINKNGLKFRNTEFISLNEEDSKLKIAFKTVPQENSYLELSDFTLQRIAKSLEEEKIISSLFFGKDEIQGSIGTETLLSISNQSVKALKDLEVFNDVRFSRFLEYRKVDNGYDLYISE